MRIKSYYEGIQDEKSRILHELDKIENLSHATRTPLFQDTLIPLVRNVVLNKTDGVFPPQRFRDIANAE